MRAVEHGAVERDRVAMSSRPTISTTNDWRMGMSNALTMPSRNASTMTCQTWTWPISTSSPRTSASTHAAVWVTIRPWRLGSASAATPAEQAEDHHRQELRGRDDAQRERVVGQLQHQPRLGDLLHPGARRARPAGPAQNSRKLRCRKTRSPWPAARRSGAGSCRGAVSGLTRRVGTPAGIVASCRQLDQVDRRPRRPCEPVSRDRS